MPLGPQLSPIYDWGRFSLRPPIATIGMAGYFYLAIDPLAVDPPLPTLYVTEITNGVLQYVVVGGAGTEAHPSLAITTSVPAANADTSLLLANATRLGGSVFNDSATATLFLKFGTGASASSFKFVLPPQTYFPFPGPDVYQGPVNGFWTGVIAGSARISEEVP